MELGKPNIISWGEDVTYTPEMTINHEYQYVCQNMRYDYLADKEGHLFICMATPTNCDYSDIASYFNALNDNHCTAVDYYDKIKDEEDVYIATGYTHEDAISNVKSDMKAAIIKYRKDNMLD